MPKRNSLHPLFEQALAPVVPRRRNELPPIGCVKGQSGYWNKIRRDFPEIFAKMAATERKLNAAICKKEGVSNGKRWRKRVFLDELPPDAGRYEAEPDIECGVLCNA